MHNEKAKFSEQNSYQPEIIQIPIESNQSLSAKEASDQRGMEWYGRRAKEVFAWVTDGVWDVSDPILMWTPEGVAEYQRLQREAGYKENVEHGESGFLRQVAGDVARLLPDNFICVDLGPGTGKVSALFLESIRRNGKRVKEYVGIDISEEMLQETQARMELAQVDNVRLLQTSFEEGLERSLSSEEPRLITVLGLTLFNSGIQGLDIIKNHLREQDKAFLDVQLRERIDMENLRRAYTEHVVFHNAKLGLLGLKLGESVDSLSIDDNMEVSVRITKLNSFLEEKGVEIGDKIILARSYRPTLDEVTNYFEKDGFRVDVLDRGGEFVGIMVEKDTLNPDTTNLKPPVLAEDHPYRPYFEGPAGIEAYRRMAAGSRELMPYLEKYVSQGHALEVGPFYNPLITSERFPEVVPTYLDRDDAVLEFVGRGGAQVVQFDFEKSDPAALDGLPLQDAIVTSQIINYVDLDKFIGLLSSHLKEGGYLFINDSIDYAVEELLHPNRARSIEEVLTALRTKGFHNFEYRIVPTPDPEHQKNPRLVLTAQKVSSGAISIPEGQE